MTAHAVPVRSAELNPAINRCLFTRSFHGCYARTMGVLCVVYGVSHGPRAFSKGMLHSASGGNSPTNLLAGSARTNWASTLPSRGSTVLGAADPRVAPPATDTFADLGSPEPQIPVMQLVFILICTAVPMAYWWYIIVPTKRREVAASKRRGEMREYLEELAATPAGERKSEKWFYDKYLREAKLVDKPRPAGVPEAVNAFEENLQETLPGGGFWSFDNPVFIYLVLFGGFCVTQLVARALDQ